MIGKRSPVRQQKNRHRMEEDEQWKNQLGSNARQTDNKLPRSLLDKNQPFTFKTPTSIRTTYHRKVVDLRKDANSPPALEVDTSPVKISDVTESEKGLTERDLNHIRQPQNHARRGRRAE